MNDPAFTVAVVALILATAALVGFVALLLSIVRGPDPEPPPWVNDGPCRPRTRRGDWRERCNT